MAKRLHPGKSTAAEVRRVAKAALDEALELLAAHELPPDAAVHEVRKRIKRLRALLLLVERSLGRRFAELDGTLRTSARRLSAAREAAAALEAIERLRAEKPDRAPPASFAAARQGFELAEPRAGTALGELLSRAAQDLTGARRALSDVSFDEDGFDLIEPGLRRTYRRARRRLRQARRRATAEDFHELRKAVKAHQHQLQLVEPAWPALVGARREALAELGELLGEQHDLSLLEPELLRRGVPDVARLARERRAELERTILDRAALLLAEPARHFAATLRAWFEASGER